MKFKPVFQHIFNFILKVRWFISAYIALTIFFLIKKFAFDIVRVNNNDMEETYAYGSAVLIKKSLNTYALNDVLYFEYPIIDSSLTKTYFIQRLFGIPGDSVELINKLVYVNGLPIADTPTVKHNYFVKTRSIRLDSLFKLKYNLTEGGEVSDQFDYSYSLTAEESENLRKDSSIQYVELKVEKMNTYDETVFPESPYYKWNLDHYGKIYIPKINDTLRLDTVNIKLYSILISEHEKNDLLVSGDSIMINGELSSYYVVKKNYYFVLGDNRDNANDSRVWGFLPENCIVGKVVRRLRNSK
jgi:signal peptidase I